MHAHAYHYSRKKKMLIRLPFVVVISKNNNVFVKFVHSNIFGIYCCFNGEKSKIKNRPIIKVNMGD